MGEKENPLSARDVLKQLTQQHAHAISYALAGMVAAGALVQGPIGAMASAGPDADPGSRAAADVRASSAAKRARTVKAAHVLKIAKRQLGTRSGSKYDSWYRSTENAKLTAQRDGGKVAYYKGAQWCDMFVSWVGAQTGVSGMGWDAYTVEHARWFKKTGRWGTTKAKPGAVVFFAWQGGGIRGIDHVGLVVKDNGRTISTIEGNTDGAVRERVRPKAKVAGYGYPDYKHE